MASYVVVADDGTYAGRFDCDDKVGDPRTILTKRYQGRKMLPEETYQRICHDNAVPSNCHDTDMVRIYVNAKCKAVLEACHLCK